MSSETEKTAPKAELELGTNDPSHCIWKTLNYDSGAGANASSTLDMKFVASGALSELVWSPDKGLSVKCADSSFADKNTSLFWDVGPSNMVLGPPKSAIGESSGADKPISAICIKSGMDDIDMNAAAGNSDGDSGVKPEYKAYEEHETGKGFIGNMEERNIEGGVLKLHDDQMGTHRGTAQISQTKEKKSPTVSGEFDKRSFGVQIPKADELKSGTDMSPLPRDHATGARGIGISNQEIEANNELCAKDELVAEYKGTGAPGTNVTSSSRGSLEKLESTAENDLRTSNCDAACGASGALVSNSRAIDNKSHDNEMMLLCDKNLPTAHSPSNSKINIMSNKGKEKALSDGIVRLSKEDGEDDSHESVESCNSARLFSKGKRKWNFQHQLTKSKRFKTQVQETSGPKYIVKQDSSFMSWISNMMKGFSQTIQDEANPLHLKLERTDHVHQLPSAKFIRDHKNHDPGPKSAGFQSIFQAMYSPMGTRIPSVSHQARDSSEDLSNKVPGIDATPITFCAENDYLYKQYNPSNESEQSARRYDAGPSTQPKVELINVVYSHESSKNDSVENRNCSTLLLIKEKEGMVSNSSSGRQNTNNAGNINAYVFPDKKEENVCRRSDVLGSLWITRFSRKSTAPLIISNNSKTPEQKFKNEDTMEAKESYNRSLFEKASNVAKNNLDIDIHNSVRYPNPVLPSPKVTNSEPIASVFARRLDAIKYIKPSHNTSNTPHTNVTCMFCGTRGHQLHDCLEIAESELDALLKNINSYGKLEELPCLCIRCFQPNHWAISCPMSTQIEKHDLKVNAMVNDCGPSESNFNAGKEESSRPLTGEEDLPLPRGAINDEIDLEGNQNLDLKWTSNETLPSENIDSRAPIKKVFGANSMENKLKESSVTSSCGFIGRQISDKTKRIFDAVQKLRLSRTEILRWINSQMSVSNLDGFFLRLRLGKWEEGLGGTGYYVASINEAQRGSSQQNTRKSISVIVGGIKCMVESQYISNHDFLEEEIVAWWYTNSKAGNNVPSEEDLVEKIKMKQILGF